MSEPAPRGRAWLALGAGAVSLYLLAALTGLEPLRLAVKPIPAAALAFWVLRGDATARVRFIALGLGLSALADAAIEAAFLAGVGLFLLAHLAYVAGFLADGRAPAVPRALPPALYGLGMYALVGPGLGPLRVPVAIYMIAICAMVWRAAARVGQHGRPTAGEWAGLVGATLFGASDSIIAWNRFLEPLPWAPLPIILLYWAGQAGIAVSARRP